MDQGTAHLDSGHNLLSDCGSGAAASGHAGHTVDRTKELGTVDLPHVHSVVSNTQAKHLEGAACRRGSLEPTRIVKRAWLGGEAHRSPCEARNQHGG